jgi:hypothetical protein
MAATNTHVPIEELLEEVFSVRSVPRLYNEDQLPNLQENRVELRSVSVSVCVTVNMCVCVCVCVVG